METIILVTVFSTLGVVALVTAIVVAFVKLSKKVDVNRLEKDVDNIWKHSEQVENSIYDEMNQSFENFERVVGETNNDLHRKIDSRFDKLYTEADKLNTRCDDLQTMFEKMYSETMNNKQLLKG